MSKRFQAGSNERNGVELLDFSLAHPKIVGWLTEESKDEILAILNRGLRPLLLTKGDSVDVTLASGTRLNIECTQDTTDITGDDGQVFFSEEESHGVWDRITPEKL